jgi:hypothetical protein
VIFPFGVYASQGFWYSAPAATTQEGNERLLEGRPLPLGLQRGRARHAAAAATHTPRKLDARGKGRPRAEVGSLRVSVSERGAKSFELVCLLGRIEVGPGGGAVVESEIPRSEIGFYASRLLGVGTEVRVESPVELVRAMRERALAVACLYD